MQVLAYLAFDLSQWTTWLTLGVGLAVGIIVFVVLSRYKHRLLLARLANEDLPWEKLLTHLRKRHRALAGSAGDAEEELQPEDYLSMLLSQHPGKSGLRTADTSPSERQYRERGCVERRTSRRRWGNPTEVYLNSPRIDGTLHGLVINRSAQGLAIFVNQEIPPGTTLTSAPTRRRLQSHRSKSRSSIAARPNATSSSAVMPARSFPGTCAAGSDNNRNPRPGHLAHYCHLAKCKALWPQSTKHEAIRSYNGASDPRCHYCHFLTRSQAKKSEESCANCSLQSAMEFGKMAAGVGATEMSGGAIGGAARDVGNKVMS